MNIYKLRSLIHLFDQHQWIQGIQQLSLNNNNQHLEVIQEAYFKNMNQIHEDSIKQIINLLLKSNEQTQALKLSRIVHHYVIQNSNKIQALEEIIVKTQQLTISEKMQQDNLIEILDSLSFRVALLHPLPKQIERVYFEENISISF